MPWLREFSTFIVSLCREWAVLLTGGVLSGCLFTWSGLSGRPIQPRTWLVFVSVTLLFATFFSWRKQWREAEKNFVQIGPAALMALRDGKTSPLATTLLKPYIGKRLKITGTFNDVSSTIFGMKMVHFRCENVMIGAHVPFWTARKFIPMPREMVITVTGTISEVNSLWISLSGIELVPNPPIAPSTLPLLKEVAA